MQLESLQAENTENFPVPEEMCRHLAVLSKSNKWLLRYENLLLQKQVVLKQIDQLIKDGVTLQSDPDVNRAMVDLQANHEQCKDWLARYKSFDSAADPKHEGLFQLLADGANIGLKLKEYKALKDFCIVLRKSIAHEQQALQTSNTRMA